MLNVILMFSEEESNDCSTNNQEEDSGSRDGSPEEEARLQRILAKHFQSRRFMMVSWKWIDIAKDSDGSIKTHFAFLRDCQKQK